jgi:hypothetical protein
MLGQLYRWRSDPPILEKSKVAHCRKGIDGDSSVSMMLMKFGSQKFDLTDACGNEITVRDKSLRCV